MTEFNNSALISNNCSTDELFISTQQENFDPTLKKTINCASDAFRMKAYSLIETHNVPYRSVQEILSNIKEAEIKTSIDQNSLDMQLSLSFPQETILIKGSFQHDDSLKSRVIPMKESFELVRLGHPN